MLLIKLKLIKSWWASPLSRLVDEVAELEDSVRKLELKTDESEERLRELQHTRLSLERDLDVKRNSLGIDRDR